MSPPTPQTFAAHAAYASEALRHWGVGAEWLDGDGPADDPGLPIEARLRRRRQLGSLRILYHELSGRHDVEATGRALSSLARGCLDDALAEARARVTERFGELPGGPRLAILALGKLGGDEVNFNSDLDLVFVHDAQGESDGRRSLSARDWLTRVVRELTGLMESVTAQGRVWVVDTRLRPFGQSGALVWSVDAMEQYFVNEGRAWERYAWLKAGVAAGDVEIGQDLIERLSPFVFRRYLDYGLFDNLRELHAEIDRKSRREDLADDIKRGPGGIRELEFLIQSLQLLRGGRDPSLRVGGFLPALRAAADLRLLSVDETATLEAAYRFLRTLENCIQAATGRQTQRMPDAAEPLAAIAGWMGLANGRALQDRLEDVRRTVRRAFQARFETQPASPPATAAPWPPGEEVEQRLVALGFEAPEPAAAALRRLAERLGRRPLSAEARRRLDRLMPALFARIEDLPEPDAGFDDLLGLIETIAQRSAYLSLLHERPETLDRTVRVFRRTDRVARWVIDSPQLLDDLLDPVNGFELPEPPQMLIEDVESSLNALARFRQAGYVRTALGQLDGGLDRRAAGRQLTRLAEAVLDAVAQLTLTEADEVTMIGYGNLGAGELHYSSDLDLVFLHADGDPPRRGIQRLINALQLPLPGGRLYEVDTRLRPNGNAGLLVSSIDHFARYQDDEAWTWEHQALVRARAVYGDPTTIERFEAIRRQVLCRPRDPDATRAALAEMRERQRRQREESEIRRILGHLQFTAELGILLQAHRTPTLCQQRGLTGQLNALADCGWLDRELATTMIELQAEASALRDRDFLERGEPPPTPDRLIDAAEAVWTRVFGAG
ncbi:bifunctional [glutamate--ammonia ligase]-adenylyl-L-tyrosine phosphorylase/[glutamate--ammonia-ligase] adenylyltransferase [Wenzhouxiangella sp. XN79A]|uniref:bifunctional [glutamate--ammonia ligase]-adenylyl-L-tyrosine phosphorylase/[glutamate--ammonia-ligase] adenylyltransferase n=1 Tax=Wenzhouxiangella sp. XN79A TaxID=2724193 RepID=UPI00144A5B47|nr:bifunctional [glutamate--ammonia ligase]-adenylyl-L-tyrosine phosphorylase/[glutamate--ammonia-ligase] adenylyltransferase [Wenzhouxiangella sp. XN79A]NKI33570.1 bifunctional [glutamate--ammonia ligase]-adenylyl-L-tyrosine phosphorylase/[glutamate--ammonia-ligase] adenylyltransferase [Wenzhouxiangella sp. XN79A]